ncbi:MAG: hypothetical protein KME10_24865 [Plectolyngbya sp. WJT66-NPBG17]|jgi:hypothetical protein|nr:hypothetical protein [Plectolyngbya sp. WJT66-NPBG17]MBW4525053.1 hypothetical protein [Phormidium tanganyikae FI6-MK23]
MSDYTKRSIQAWFAVLIGGAIGLTLLATFSPVETGSAIDNMKTRIQELQR